MTQEVKKIFDPHISDPEVSGLFGNMINDIGNELKSTDLSKGDLFENILHIAEKMSQKMTTDASNNKCSPEKLLNATQNVMKDMGLPEGLDPSQLLSGGNGMNALSGVMSNLFSKKGMLGLMNMVDGMTKNKK